MSPLTPPHKLCVDARIATAMQPGYPVVTRRSLRRAGVDRRAVARRAADGRLNEIWSGTFLVGVAAADASPELIAAAAVASGGPRAALDGTSALARRGLWPRHDDSIQVVAPHSRPHVAGHDVWFRRAECFRTEPVAGLPTRVALEALLVAARDLTPHQLASVIDRGEYLHEFCLDDIDAFLQSRQRARGALVLRRAVALRRAGSVGTRSRSEDRLLPYAAARYGEPLVNVRGAAGMPDYEPDLCWPDRRWIVEVDGGHHLNADAARRDHDRDALLRAAGWTVVRIPWRLALHDPESALRRIAAAFGE